MTKTLREDAHFPMAAHLYGKEYDVFIFAKCKYNKHLYIIQGEKTYNYIQNVKINKN